jgi:hypothetical protein
MRERQKELFSKVLNDSRLGIGYIYFGTVTLALLSDHQLGISKRLGINVRLEVNTEFLSNFISSSVVEQVVEGGTGPNI